MDDVTYRTLLDSIREGGSILRGETSAAQSFTVDDDIRERLPNPPCKNHPDRQGIAFYSKKPIWALCRECFEQRLAEQAQEPLDDHGSRMAKADKTAVENRGNV